MGYDDYGRNKTITTPAGITTYKYLASGLIDEINVHGEITKYKYDSKNRIDKIGIAGVHEQSFMYDSNNRPIKITETIDGSKTYDFKTEYDAYGRVKKEVYPSGFYVSNEYDENGFLISVTGSKGEEIWEAVAANVKGQLTRYKQGGHETVVDYHDIWGLPNTIVSGDSINMAYYYTEKGNLDYREDKATSGRIQKEKFYYDKANRLKDYDLSLNGTLKQSNTILYDPLTGGIHYKTDVGFNMEYGQNTPFHALSVVQGLPESAKAPQAITYSNINKVKSVTQGDKQHQITYGVNQQRIKGIFKTGSTTTLTKYYLGNYEEEVVSGNTRKLHYIYGGNGLAAIMEYKNGQENLFYTFSDYQGNLLAVTNTSGTFLERYAYDPWGARRNPNDWTQPDTRSSFLFSRGYTMHEHLDDFGLINMNGRVYDPLMAQFFSPDPHLQSPGNWYNYNRYAYGFNNPLLYNDPSGYFFKKFGNWLKKSFDNLGDWMVKHNLSIGVGTNITPGGGPMTYTADINGQQVFNSANGNQFDPGINAIKAVDDMRTINDYGGARAFANLLRNSKYAVIPGTGVGPGDAFNPFYQAEAAYFDAGAVFIAGEHDKGSFFVLTGDDIGMHPFSETAGGFSAEISLSAGWGRIDYTGDPSRFKASMLYGERTKAWLGAGVVVGGSLDFAWARQRGTGHYVISSGWSGGLSLNPYIFSFGINHGEIFKR